MSNREKEMQKIRGRLLELMVKYGITHMNVCKACGISHVTLRKFMRDERRPSFYTEMKIKRFLDKYEGASSEEEKKP